jgi:hypothetical protein
VLAASGIGFAHNTGYCILGYGVGSGGVRSEGLGYVSPVERRHPLVFLNRRGNGLPGWRLMGFGGGRPSSGSPLIVIRLIQHFLYKHRLRHGRRSCLGSRRRGIPFTTKAGRRVSHGLCGDNRAMFVVASATVKVAQMASGRSERRLWCRVRGRGGSVKETFYLLSGWLLYFGLMLLAALAPDRIPRPGRRPTNWDPDDPARPEPERQISSRRCSHAMRHSRHPTFYLLCESSCASIVTCRESECLGVSQEPMMTEIFGTTLPTHTSKRVFARNGFFCLNDQPLSIGWAVFSGPRSSEYHVGRKTTYNHLFCVLGNLLVSSRYRTSATRAAYAPSVKWLDYFYAATMM